MKDPGRILRFLSGAVLAIGICATQARADVFSTTGTGSQADLAASANFVVSGDTLTVTLANTSTFDVQDPSRVLTAFFFSTSNANSLTPFSALLASGSTVFFGPDGGGNVGGEWAYGTGLSGTPLGATNGISSAGFGLFGNGNFNGANLQGPVSVDGLQYGLTSAGDNLATGNSAVTGGNALIKNSVEFTFSGATGFVADAAHITNWSFQYGTAFGEPNIPEPSVIACAGTVTLFGLGLAWRRRKGRKA